MGSNPSKGAAVYSMSLEATRAQMTSSNEQVGTQCGQQTTSKLAHAQSRKPQHMHRSAMVQLRVQQCIQRVWEQPRCRRLQSTIRLVGNATNKLLASQGLGTGQKAQHIDRWATIHSRVQDCTQFNEPEDNHGAIGSKQWSKCRQCN